MHDVNQQIVGGGGISDFLNLRPKIESRKVLNFAGIHPIQSIDNTFFP
jgi:hypothetical protein